MRQWRVGTVSMGSLLLFSGIGLLYAQFNQLAVAQLALKWWPVLFVVLGIEVLLRSYFNRSEETRVKYDLLSIFIILFIVLTGLGIQTASEVGLVKYAQNMISMQQFTLQSPTSEVPLDDQIQRIVIEAESSPSMRIHTTPSNLISYYAAAQLRAQSKEEAQNLMLEKVQVNARQVGNALYLSMNVAGSEQIYDCIYNLILPESLAVEIDHSGASLQIISGKISNDWTIQGKGTTEISLPVQSDLLITALTSNPSSLKGNLNWSQTGRQTLPGQVKVDINGNEVQAQVKGQNSLEISDGSSGNIQAQAKLGNGTHKLTIISDDDITVHQLP